MSSFTFNATSSDVRLVSAVRGSGWRNMQDATRLATRIDELKITLVAYVESANRASGLSNVRTGYSRIAQLVKLVRAMGAADIPVLDIAPSAHADSLATLLDQCALSAWHKSKTSRGLKAEDILPDALATIAAHADVSDMLDALKAYHDSLAPAQADEPKGNVSPIKSESEDETSSGSDNADETISPTDDVLAHIMRAAKVVKTLTALPAAELREIIGALHSLADTVADIPEIDNDDDVEDLAA